MVICLTCLYSETSILLKKKKYGINQRNYHQ